MVEKIFVTSNSNVAFSCPECGKTIRKDVSRYMKHDAQVRLKYKCSCKHSFSIKLERRLSIRKEGHLKGCIVQDKTTTAISIKDLSKHGLRINMLKNIHLEEGQVVKIDFVLDDPNQLEVSKRVKVIKINSPTDVSCEFLNKDHQGNLGKYFLFYF